MILFWIIVLPLDFLMKSIKKLIIHTFDEFGDLQQQAVQHLDSIPQDTGGHTFHAYLHESNPTKQDWKSVGLILAGNLNKSYKIHTR